MLELWDVLKLLPLDFFTTIGQKQTYTAFPNNDNDANTERFVSDTVPRIDLDGVSTTGAECHTPSWHACHLFGATMA